MIIRIQKNTMSIARYMIGIILMILLTTFISACVRQMKPDPTMPFHPGMGLRQAVTQAMKDLDDPERHTEFDRYFSGLVEIAENNPDITNKKIFSDFLLFANRKGILTKSMAQDYYNRYFNLTFMSLPDRYNVSSTCTNKTKILADMEAELLQKERGLLKACQDKETYYLAYDHYQTLKVVYDATCMASESKR